MRVCADTLRSVSCVKLACVLCDKFFLKKKRSEHLNLRGTFILLDVNAGKVSMSDGVCSDCI